MTAPITDLPDTTWWLKHLIDQLLTRQPILDLRERYVEGDHDIPTGDRRYIRALRNLQKLARTNYCGLVASAPVERMRVRGFRFGPTGTADEDAKKIWSANDMDLQASVLHLKAAKFGMAYTLVEPPDPDSDSPYPKITVRDPRCAITYSDPYRPTLSLAGLELWADDIQGHILACLYLPDATYEFIGPPLSELQGMSLLQLKQKLIGSGIFATGFGFELVNTIPNEIGMVPLVEYVWRPESGIIPEGECDLGVRDIQDRINATILDRMVISRAQAYKQRYATGVKIPKGKKGQRKPPFDPGADMLWVTEDPDAKFGEFTSADIRQVAEVIRDDIADIAAISKTPAYYLMGKMANVSGETLTQADAGLVSKTRQRMYSIGWGHETTIKVAFAYMGNTAKATDVEAETLWADPQVQLISDQAQAVSLFVTAGVALELAMERVGFSPEEIDFAVAERDRMQQEQEARQDQVMQQQAKIAAQNSAQKPGGQSKPGAANNKKPKTATPGKPGPTK